MIKMNSISLYGITDKGRYRNKNEDSILVDGEKAFCLVADGIGGSAGGRIASRMFANQAKKVFTSPTTCESHGADRIKETFKTANDGIFAYAATDPSFTGMGCTAELLLFTNQRFILGHLGDTRTYRLRQGRLKQLTRDHSLVQEQLEQGMITREEALTHALKNVVLKAVGITENPELDILKGNIFAGDIFLLCSDGLTDMLEDGILESQLLRHAPIQEKAENLISLANAAGGKDNISVVLAEVH